MQEKTNQELLVHAKTYIDKLANGINPLTNDPVPENDTINNIHISRCLFYVSNVLSDMIDDQVALRNMRNKSSKKKPFSISREQLSKYQFTDKYTVSEIVNQLNALANLEECKKLNYSQITNWLLEIGALELWDINGKTAKRPTQQGIELGIATEQRQGSTGEYTVVVYNRSAQQFILDNLEAIVSSSEQKVKRENQGKPWSEEHQNCLIELFKKQVPISEIAVTLQRSEEGIRSRLKKLGLIETRANAN